MTFFGDTTILLQFWLHLMVKTFFGDMCHIWTSEKIFMQTFPLTNKKTIVFVSYGYAYPPTPCYAQIASTAIKHHYKA